MAIELRLGNRRRFEHILDTFLHFGRKFALVIIVDRAAAGFDFGCYFVIRRILQWVRIQNTMNNLSIWFIYCV